MDYPSGKPFDHEWEKVSTDDLPTQIDVMTCIHEVQLKTEKWLTNLDFYAENEPFPWAGETKLGVVIFCCAIISFILENSVLCSVRVKPTK